MWPQVLPKKGAMPDMAWVPPNRPFILILPMQFIRYGKIEAGKQGLTDMTEEKIIALGKEVVKEKYGNLFDMYEKITGENPYEMPMRIYPAVHYTMGGLWVDYELMTNIPGLYSLGEANFLIMVQIAWVLPL